MRRRTIIIVGTTLLILLTVIVLWKLHVIEPKLDIEYNQETLVVGQAYNLKDLIHVNNQQVKSIDIIKSNIDNTKAGEYEVIYRIVTVDNYDYNVKAQFNMVNDTKAPDIKEQSVVILKIGQPFNIQDYVKAVDNADGDVSGNIQITSGNLDCNTIGEYNVTFQVCDKAKNRSDGTMTIIVGDTEAPVISVNTPINITVGDSFDIKKKISAIDNIDGDVTKSVQILGKVNTSTVGVYNIVLSVTDRSGNKATKDVVVNVNNNYKDANTVAKMIIEYLEDNAKNPQSLQIHNMQESGFIDNLGRNLTVAKIDYSAQNGFGGYNRELDYYAVYNDGSMYENTYYDTDHNTIYNFESDWNRLNSDSTAIKIDTESIIKEMKYK